MPFERPKSSIVKEHQGKRVLGLVGDEPEDQVPHPLQDTLLGAI